MIKFIHLIVFCVTITACKKSTETVSVENENPEINAFIVNYYEAMSKRDWADYKTYFTDEAILTTIWQGPEDLEPKLFTSSISEFLAQTKDGPDSMPIFEEKPIEIDIERKEGLANVWVYYSAKFGTEDNLIEWKGYDLFSLLNFNDQWYITSITYVSTE